MFNEAAYERLMSMATTDMPAEIARAFEAFNDHDPDGVAAEFAEYWTFFDPPQDTELTKAELRAYCAELFEAFPDVEIEVDRIVVGTDGLTAVEWTFAGTHEGEIDGMPPTGNPFEMSGVSVIAVSDDAITSWRDYWDQQTFAEQVGLA